MRTKMQIIFQDPYGSLNPRMPVSDIIGEGLLAQGVNNQQGSGSSGSRTPSRRSACAGTTPGAIPHEFSGGQRQRIGIARALVLNPEFIVCDEAVSALDVSIQSQILNLLLDLRREMGLTYLFVAHNLSVVQYVSDRVGVMYLGQMVELAGVDEIYAHPRHPYTIALLSAVPEPGPPRPQEAHRPRRRRAVAGEPAERLPVPYPLLAAQAPRQPGELRDRGARSSARSGPATWWPAITPSRSPTPSSRELVPVAAAVPTGIASGLADLVPARPVSPPPGRPPGRTRRPRLGLSIMRGSIGPPPAGP